MFTHIYTHICVCACVVKYGFFFINRTNEHYHNVSRFEIADNLYCILLRHESFSLFNRSPLCFRGPCVCMCVPTDRNTRNRTPSGKRIYIVFSSFFFFYSFYRTTCLFAFFVHVSAIMNEIRDRRPFSRVTIVSPTTVYLMPLYRARVRSIVYDAARDWNSLCIIYIYKFTLYYLDVYI